MEFLGKIKGTLIALIALSFCFVLSTQNRFDVFDIGPQDDLPELQVPRIITPPHLIAPRIFSHGYAADGPARALIPEPSDYFGAPLFYELISIGIRSRITYRIPLSWRFNNPSTAPPDFTTEKWEQLVASP